MLFLAAHVSRSFPQGDDSLTALDDVTLIVREHEYVAIAGPSGGGKSTLLNVLGLLDGEFSGHLEFRNQKVHGLSARERAALRLAGIGIVFQRFHLLPMLDVRDNVALPNWRLHGARRRARARAEELLAQMKLGHRLRHDPSRLSGGEMQRVAIARALVNDPPVLLADEPTGNLDASNTRAVLRIFDELAEAGRTLVVISHNPEVVTRAKRVLVLHHGKVTVDVPVGQIMEPRFNPWSTLSGTQPPREGA